MSVKNFLKSTLVLSLLIVSTAAFAQQPMQQRTPEERADARAIKRDKNEDLKAVLTGAQFDRYQQHVQEMKERKMDRRAGSGGNGGY